MPPEAAAIPSDPRRWVGLAVLVLPVMLIAVDNTVLGFAIPQLTADLRPSSSQLLWIIDIYSFVVAGFLVLMGSLGDRIGRRKLLLIGGACFGAASLLAAFAPTAAALIAARALLGAAGATLMPSTLSLISNLFPDHRERGTALAVWAVMFGVGGTIGPIIGGVMLEHFWWGSVFLLALPIIALLLIVGPWLLPESRDPAPGAFDILSAVLSLGAILPFVYGIKLIAEHGVGVSALLAIVFGVVFGVAFVARQRGLVDPLIDLGLFSFASFRVGITATFTACVAMAFVLFALTQYLQLVIGLSPVAAGLHLVPALLAALVATALARRAGRRVRAGTLVALGLACSAVGFVMLVWLGVGSGALLGSLAYVPISVGLNITLALGVDAIMSRVPPARAGAGSAISETANELGIALGTGVIGAVLTAVYRRRLQLDAAVDPEMAAAARETLGAAVDVTAHSGDPLAAGVGDAARAAFVDGVRVGAVLSAVIVLVAAWWVWRNLDADRQRRSTDVAPRRSVRGSRSDRGVPVE